jgi:endonuclease G, mitochondrial
MDNWETFMESPARVAQGARNRIKQSVGQIHESLKAIQEGRPGDAEKDEDRRSAVLQIRTGIPIAMARRESKAIGAEAIWGKTIDFVDVAFLERGAIASRSVCRIITQDGQGLGTGFLISPRLLITNNHVIPSEVAARGLFAEFDYERDRNGVPKSLTRFELDRRYFVTNDQDNLDYSLIAVGSRVLGVGELANYGYSALSSARNKHALGDHVNIIQHPDGRRKEAVVRENQLVSRPKSGTVLHYVTDTEPGSSGSPVFNTQWNVVALHHWGGPHRELFDDDGLPVPKNINEGIRISAIVLDLETRRLSLSANIRALVDEALKLKAEDVFALGLKGNVAENHEIHSSSNALGIAASLQPDGSVSWAIPLQLSARIGGPNGDRGKRLKLRSIRSKGRSRHKLLQ